MTKADLVEEVIRVADLSKKDAEIVVNTVFSQIIEALQERRQDRACAASAASACAGAGRATAGTPRPGTASTCRRKRIPYFKPGKELRDLINGHDGARHAAGESTAD